MKHFLRISMAIMVALATFTSCNKDDDDTAKQAEIDEQIIVDYLAANNITAQRDDSGLYYTINVEGTGDHPTVNSTVEVYYKGTFTDGSIFDQTTQGPISFSLQNLITGWQIGIPLMKKGGKATFYTPSALGYGTQGAGSVPANTVLIFDIDLIGIL